MPEKIYNTVLALRKNAACLWPVRCFSQTKSYIASVDGRRESFCCQSKPDIIDLTDAACHIRLVLTELYIPFLVTTLLMELTPGPNMIWLVLTSANKGKRAGFAAVAGIAAGLAILAAASTVGLAELATRSPMAFHLLRYAGAAYLLWLAWKTWAGENGVKTHVAINGTAIEWFRHGLFLNLLNPKAIVFFIVVLPAYVRQDASIEQQTILLSVSYVGIATAVHLIIVALAARAHVFLTIGNKPRVIQRIFAVLLAVIAIWSLISTR